MKAEARVALLGYYKDQLVSHAAILLSLPLLALAALTAWKQLELDFFYVPTITAGIAIASWQAFRLVLYSRMVLYAMRAKPRHIPVDARESAAYKGERAVFEETYIWALRNRATELIHETNGVEGWQPSKSGRVVHLMASPKLMKASPWRRLTFHIYSLVGYSGVAWEIWTRSALAPAGLGLGLALSPLFLFWAICMFLSGIVDQ